MEQSKIVLACFYMFIGLIILMVIGLEYEKQKGKKAKRVNQLVDNYVLEYKRLFGKKPTVVMTNQMEFILRGCYNRGETYMQNQISAYLKISGGR